MYLGNGEAVKTLIMRSVCMYMCVYMLGGEEGEKEMKSGVYIGGEFCN